MRKKQGEGDPQLPGDAGDWGEDAWISKLVPDPGQVPEVQVLTGFLGRSDRAACVRLYLTPQLDEYIECRQEDVLHSQRLGSEAGSLGGTMLWLRRDATVQQTRVGPAMAQAEFLQGDLSSQFLGAADLPGGIATDLALWTILIKISRRICTYTRGGKSVCVCPVP